MTHELNWNDSKEGLAPADAKALVDELDAIHTDSTTDTEVNHLNVQYTDSGVDVQTALRHPNVGSSNLTTAVSNFASEISGVSAVDFGKPADIEQGVGVN